MKIGGPRVENTLIACREDSSVSAGVRLSKKMSLSSFLSLQYILYYVSFLFNYKSIYGYYTIYIHKKYSIQLHI